MAARSLSDWILFSPSMTMPDPMATPKWLSRIMETHQPRLTSSPGSQSPFSRVSTSSGVTP